jgi:Tfp pilus assembly protein PilN
MIKVNLAGMSRKKAVKVPGRPAVSVPKNAMPAVLLAVVLGFAGFGYWWYASLASQHASLLEQVTQLNKEKKELDAIIKADMVFEQRKKILEHRVKIIEDLQRTQVSPVIALDLLSEAIDRTDYIWLSNLAQNNAQLSMSGTGTSMVAVANFMTNLGATGYFPRVELSNAVENNGVVTFSISAEFVPPSQQQPVQEISALQGGN